MNARSVQLLLLLVTLLLGACGTRSPSSVSSASPMCSPRPCASADGVTVTFTGLNPNAPSGTYVVAEGYHLILMKVAVLNGSSATRNVSPSHFELHDGADFLRPVEFPPAPGCESWQASDVAPG